LNTKTFIAYSKKINSFLTQNKIEVIDIKFSGSILYVSAMILYKEMK